jgi:hypothetical protein
MIRVAKLISNSFDSLGRLVSKFARMGKDDVQEVVTAAPFGIDSRAIKDLIALHAETGVSGESVVIGFINKDCLSGVGEMRIFSTDSNGNLETYIHLKNNGDIHFGGTSGNMVRYQQLESAFNQLKSDHNALVQKWNNFVAAYVPGSPTTIGLPPTLVGSNVTPSTADITGAKIDEFKTL